LRVFLRVGGGRYRCSWGGGGGELLIWCQWLPYKELLMWLTFQDIARCYI